jgi:hypothetical protein
VGQCRRQAARVDAPAANPSILFTNLIIYHLFFPEKNSRNLLSPREIF